MLFLSLGKTIRMIWKTLLSRSEIRHLSAARCLLGFCESYNEPTFG